MNLQQTKIDTQLFLQIITAEDGVELDYADQVEDELFHYYKGKEDDVVSICASDEFISNRTAKAYMRQLGIDDLIISLFPDDQEQTPAQ
jgi:hypothetical protein